VGKLDRQDLAATLPVDAMAICTACEPITPSMRIFS
jgi:hypothetical protein